MWCMLIFINKGRDLHFKVDSERQILEKFLPEICWEAGEEIFSSYFNLLEMSDLRLFNNFQKLYTLIKLTGKQEKIVDEHNHKPYSLKKIYRATYIIFIRTVCSILIKTSPLCNFVFFPQLQCTFLSHIWFCSTKYYFCKLKHSAKLIW